MCATTGASASTGSTAGRSSRSTIGSRTTSARGASGSAPSMTFSTSSRSSAMVLSTPTDTQILMTREFAAPAALVWRAYTEPELVSRWWPGKRGTMQSCEIDFRVGGSWRYVMTASQGFEVAFHGEYQEIVEHERIVNTEVFDCAPGPGIVVTTTFTADGDRTVLEMLSECG